MGDLDRRAQGPYLRSGPISNTASSSRRRHRNGTPAVAPETVPSVWGKVVDSHNTYLHLPALQNPKPRSDGICMTVRQGVKAQGGFALGFDADR